MVSVCRSLQCLIFALTQVGGGRLFFGFACSVVLCGGRGTANEYQWRVWGVFTVFWPHWVCPCSQLMCFPHLHCSGSRLLYREWTLSWVHFPGPKPLRYPTKTQTGMGLRFVPSLAPTAQATRNLTSALPPGVVRLIPSAVPASVSARWFGVPCLFWGADFWLRHSGWISTTQKLWKFG